MCASANFNQFQPDSDNEELTNLQRNVASLEKRLDELQKSGSTSNSDTIIRSLETDINNIQHQIDNAAKSGGTKIRDLSAKFNNLKSLATTKISSLSEKINDVNTQLQENTEKDLENNCFMHLDGSRASFAAEEADQMTTDAVLKLIKDYWNTTKSINDKEERLSEFITYMKDVNRRTSCKSSLAKLDLSLNKERLLFTLVASSKVQNEPELFTGGTLLSNKAHQMKLNEFYGKNLKQQWQLIYKATTHGFSTKDFHGKCDGQAPTMIVIQSKAGNLFGAYTKLLWSHTRGFKQDVDAFLFTLVNPNNLPPTKFDIDKSKSDNAVYHPGGGYLGESYDFYLFGFGGTGLTWYNFNDSTDGLLGFYRGDLFIAGDCNKNSYSSTIFPCSYIDTHGLGHKTFTGSKTFTVSDIEVYILKLK